MECPSCESDIDKPAGKQLKAAHIFEDNVDVDLGAQEHVQLECPECGAVLGYLGHAAAVGSTDIRGFY